MQSLVTILKSELPAHERRISARRRNESAEQGCLVDGELLRGFAEVSASGGTESVESAPEVDAVQVMDENLVLRIALLDPHGGGDLGELAFGVLSLKLVDIAGELLGKGAGSFPNRISAVIHPCRTD